jgi:hypothetical protein
MSERKGGQDKTASRPGWQDRLRAAAAAPKGGPKSRRALKAKERPASKGRIRKGKSRA